MLGFFILLLGYLPLWIIHIIGAGIGWLIYGFSPRYRRNLVTNIVQSGFCRSNIARNALIRASIIQHGIGGIELPYAWRHSFSNLAKKVRSTTGLEHIEHALSIQSPIIFILPHLGSFEICGMYLSNCLPINTTAMYRPPKLASLDKLMQAGRNRYKGKSVPANVTGLRQLIKALQKKEAILILPDQVPISGAGVWAPFFGRSAYTMTLLSRLFTQYPNATLLICFAQRLSWGKGFHVHIRPLDPPLCGEPLHDAARLNQNIERLIALAPAQYLWSYNRYKNPSTTDFSEKAK